MEFEGEMDSRLQSFRDKSSTAATEAKKFEDEVVEALEHLENVGRGLAQWLKAQGIRPHSPAMTGTEKHGPENGRIPSGKYGPTRYRGTTELSADIRYTTIIEYDIPARWTVQLPSITSYDGDMQVEDTVSLSVTGRLGYIVPETIETPKRIKRRYYEKRERFYFDRPKYQVVMNPNSPGALSLDFMGQRWSLVVSPVSGKRELKSQWGDYPNLTDALKEGVLYLVTSA